MKLHNLLNEQLILLDRSVASKEEAIRLLLRTFLAHYPFKQNQEELERTVMEREGLGGTSFPTGVAVPHARLETLNDIVILVLRPSQPIPDPIAPIRLVVLMLTSQNKPSLYLISLSSFLKISQKQNVFDRLVASKNAREFIDLVAQEDYSLVKVPVVEDLLSGTVHSIRPENTVRELLDLFYQNDLTYAPVVDAEDHVLGEVSLADVLKSGFPDYTTQMGSLRFLKSFEPFENLLQNEENVRVKQVMKPLGLGCDPSASVVELCFELLYNGRRHCPVVRGRKLVGVISIVDILSKVMRG